MDVGRARAHRNASDGVVESERKRSRVGRYVMLIFGAGVVSGTAALAGIPPFGSLQALLAPISEYLHPQPPPTPIKASALFPPVPPVHKTVDVYDPPRPVQHATPPSAPQPPATTPTPVASPRPSPSPPLHSSPSPTPGPGAVGD